MKTTSRKLFQPATLAALAIITLLGVSIRPAQAGYTVTLQEVGTDVVATGSGAIDLNGLSGPFPFLLDPAIRPRGNGVSILAFIDTGPISSSVSRYQGGLGGPHNFGSGFVITPASSGSGDMVGIEVGGGFGFGRVVVPMGYVSGTALSDMAIYNNATFATLGVTPGTTYVWTWGDGPDQNFTLQILPCTGRCGPGHRPRPTPHPRP